MATMTKIIVKEIAALLIGRGDRASRTRFPTHMPPTGMRW
jgi:hypothetical protein